MIDAFLRPGTRWTALPQLVTERASALARAADRGFRFLLLATDKPEDAVPWILASFYTGIAVVPVPGELPERELRSRREQLPRDSCLLEPPELLPARRAPQLPPMKSPDDLWVVLFSSGSSGTPKAIAVSGRALRASAEAHATHLGRFSWLLNLPLNHIGGFSILSRAYFLNTALGLASSPRLSAEEMAEWIASGSVEGVSLVPTMLLRILRAGVDLSPLRAVLLGGAPASLALREEAARAGVPLYITYGMTESCSQLATARRPGGEMVPLPGVALSVSGDGSILAKCPFLADGVFRESRLQPLAAPGDFFPTCDLGELVNGELRVLGRKSEMIISGGKNLFPVEVEEALMATGLLADCAVFPRPDPEWGQRVEALLVPARPESLSLEELRARLRLSLEPWKIPKAWFIVARVPRSANGKILRAALPGGGHSQP